jgi:hypothetical protein
MWLLSTNGIPACTCVSAPVNYASNTYADMVSVANKMEWTFQERLFNPDQIVILTDGICSSACSLFIEMMTRVGVKTVVAGGRPQTGPMQAASGNRGAAIYATTDLDDDIEGARLLDLLVDEPVTSLPQVRDTGMNIQYATVNLRDQIRKDDKTPIQFKYEAADCRIFYTLANLYNTTRLWHDVAETFTDKSRCVEGSTGFSTTNNTTPSPPPKPTAKRPTLDHNYPGMTQEKFDDNPEAGLRDGAGDNKTPIKCPAGTQIGQRCPGSKAICKSVRVNCPGSEGKKDLPVCVPDCTCVASGCNCDGKCQLSDQVEKKVSGKDNLKIKTAGNHGQCFPGVGQGSQRLGCKANPKIPK